MNWVTAITTAPRKDPTLEQCVNSVRTAGWEPIIFAEPGSVKTDCWTKENPKRLGCYHNWLHSARWCLENTTAEVILLVQDDALFHPDSRSFIESVLWPHERTGFVSLYTSKIYSYQNDGSMRPKGVQEVRPNSLWGACAMAWPRSALEEVVNLPLADEWLGAKVASGKPEVIEKRRQNPELIANSDSFMGKACLQLDRKMFFMLPSPVQHIAEHSTLGHGGNTGVRNCFGPADHKRPLAEQIPRPEATHVAA